MLEWKLDKLNKGNLSEANKLAVADIRDQRIETTYKNRWKEVIECRVDSLEVEYDCNGRVQDISIHVTNVTKAPYITNKSTVGINRLTNSQVKNLLVSLFNSFHIRSVNK